MGFEVHFTSAAARDLDEIIEYIMAHDSASAAEHVLDGIEKSIGNLGEFPNKGGYPKELLSLGIKEYRETFFKPYRIVYRVSGKTVNIHLVSDGRRDMQTFLAWRLLTG